MRSASGSAGGGHAADRGAVVVACLALMFLTTGLRAILFVTLPAAMEQASLPPVAVAVIAVLLNAGYALALWTAHLPRYDARWQVAGALLLAPVLSLGLGGDRSAASLSLLMFGMSYLIGTYFAHGVTWLAQAAPPGRRRAYMGLHEWMAMLAYAVGPLFASVLMRAADWHSVVVAWATAAAIIGLPLLLRIPAMPAREAHRPRKAAGGYRLDLRMLAHASLGACFLTLMSGFLNLLAWWLAQRWGTAATAAAATVGLARMAGLVGAPMSGRLSDRVSSLSLLATYIGAATACLAALPALAPGRAFLLVLGLLSLLTAAMSPVYYAAVAAAYPPSEGPHRMAAVLATGSTAGQVVLPAAMSFAVAQGYPAGIFHTAAGMCVLSLAGALSLKLGRVSGPPAA